MDPMVCKKFVYEVVIYVGILVFSISARLFFQYAESAF